MPTSQSIFRRRSFSQLLQSRSSDAPSRRSLVQAPRTCRTTGSLQYQEDSRKTRAMKQMRRHMENLPNLGPLQSAYRALHSTKTAMTRVVSDLLSATASKSPSVLLSLNISPAFDTLDHHRLLERAKDLFGFDSTVLQ